MRTHDTRARKGAKNQALIREVNERIERIADDVASIQFLCECADPECVEALDLSIEEYEAIRSSPVRFPVKVSHSDPELERVVEENERYAVVEKVGEAGEVARKLDPRSRERF